MIEPVNTRDYYEYKKIEEYKKIDTASGKTLENGEKFALDYEKKEDKAKKTEEKGAGGVVVELSGKALGQQGSTMSQNRQESGLYAPAGERSFADTAAGIRDFLEKITRSVTGFFRSVREMLVNFWNSDSEGAHAGTESGNKVQSVTGVIEKREEPETEEIGKERAEDFTQSGIMVKNSDLLTYYDRRGQFVKLSGSDRNRILRGDRNELKG